MPSITPAIRTFILASLLALLTLLIWSTWSNPSPTYVLADPITRPVQNSSWSILSANPSYPSHIPSSSFPIQFFTKLANKSYFTIAQFLSTYSAPLNSVFSKPVPHPFLSPTYYDSDPHGAIEVFDKHGVTVCRVYRVCRKQDASLELPLWMSDRSTLLKSKCALSNLHFKPTWTLKNRFGLPPYYDWIGPNLPTHALLKFTKVPLSYFFAHRNAKKSFLDDTTSANKVERQCTSPFGTDDPPQSSRICSTRPEGRIANPAFLINLENDVAKGDAEFREALTAHFFNIHGVEPDLFDPSSALLRKPKACFRSLIIVPDASPEVERAKHTAQDSLQNKHAIDAAKILWQPNRTHGVLGKNDPLSEKLVENKTEEKLFKARNQTTQKSVWPKGESFSTASSRDTDSSEMPCRNQKSTRIKADEEARSGAEFVKELRKNGSGVHESEKGSIQAKRNSTSKSTTLTTSLFKSTVSKNEVAQSSEGGRSQEKQNATNSQHVKSVRDETQPASNYKKRDWTGKKKVSELKEGRGEVKEVDSAIKSHTNVFRTEGGVELFIHRAVHGKSWNNSNRDASKHVYGVCRIHRACRRHDRTIVLPQWMRKYENDLEAHCGLKDVSYIPDTVFNSAYEQIKTQTDNKTVYLTGLINKPNHEMELDLMGTRVYRAQEQHFMTDFFHDGLHAFDALFNQRKGRHAIFRRQCLHKPDSEVGEGTVKSWECASPRTNVGQLNPTVIVHERIMRNTPSSRYIHEVLNMMPPAGKSGPKALFAPHLSYSGPQASTCFRSIVLTRNSYPPESVMQHRERNVFFWMNNISRVSMRDVTHRMSKDGACQVRVTILKPRKQYLYYERNRKDLRIPCLEILNQHEVVRQVVRLLHGFKGNITLDMATFSHDGKGVIQARNVMQESEILLGVNNPTMTSIIFARPHTSVVEVQPFGYSPGPYRSFARSLNLNYHRVMADPDEDTFRRCVFKHYRDDWDTNVEIEEIERARDGLLHMFHDAAQAFSGDVSELQLAHRYHQNGTQRTDHIPLERVCARAQRIWVNATRIAEIIAKEAQTTCRLRATRASSPLRGTDI